MKTAKKINAIAVICAILISGTAFAAAAVLSNQNTRNASPDFVTVEVGQPMQVVVIKGKRMTAAEKAAMD